MMKIFSILKYFIKDIFLYLFHRSHKYKIVARYFTENESNDIHDIEAFVVYKCELCGDIYESNVYSAKKVCSEYSLKRIHNNLEEHGFVNQLDYFSIEEQNL